MYLMLAMELTAPPEQLVNLTSYSNYLTGFTGLKHV